MLGGFQGIVQHSFSLDVLFGGHSTSLLLRNAPPLPQVAGYLVHPTTAFQSSPTVGSPKIFDRPILFVDQQATLFRQDTGGGRRARLVIVLLQIAPPTSRERTSATVRQEGPDGLERVIVLGHDENVAFLVVVLPVLSNFFQYLLQQVPLGCRFEHRHQFSLVDAIEAFLGRAKENIGGGGQQP